MWKRYKKNFDLVKTLQERRGIQHDTVKVDKIASGLARGCEFDNAMHKVSLDHKEDGKLRQDKLTLMDSAGRCRSFRMSRTKRAASTAILSPSNRWKVASCCVKYTSRSASPSRLAHLHSDGHSDGQSAGSVTQHSGMTAVQEICHCVEEFGMTPMWEICHHPYQNTERLLTLWG